MALYKRGGGIWYFVFHINGRRYKGCTSQHDKAKARAFEDDAKARIRKGEPLNAPVNKAVPTFKEYAEAYLTGDGAQKKSVKDDRSILDRALIPFFGSMYLDEIQRADVERFRNERMEGKLYDEDRHRKETPAPGTVQRELALLKHILNVALDAGLIGRNMARGVRMPKVNNRRERVIDPDEFARLLMAVPAKKAAHMRPLMILAYETGMREGEILGLKWADVDFKAHVARLDRTKNGDPRRVPLSEKAEQALIDWTRRDSTYIFPARDGEGSRGHVSASFRRLCERAGVEGAIFHDLRHTFCTRMVERGVDLITLASITGHKTLDMLRRYSHPTDARKLALVRPAGAGLTPKVASGGAENLKTA